MSLLSSLASSGTSLRETTATLIASALSSLTVAQQLRTAAAADEDMRRLRLHERHRRLMLQGEGGDAAQQQSGSTVDGTAGLSQPPAPAAPPAALAFPPPLAPVSPSRADTVVQSADDLHAQAVVSVCERVSGSLLQQLTVPGENAVAVASSLVKVRPNRIPNLCDDTSDS